LEHFWCTDEPRANTDSQNSSQLGLGESRHLPLYNILCAWLWGLHRNFILSSDSQVVSPKIPEIGTLATWGGGITSCADLRLKWGLKQSCNPCQYFSNDVLHITCTQVNQGDSWFLVVENQIGTLTFTPSFGHNLCMKYSNGSCNPILNIYVSGSFQWYKKFFNPMSFDPCNRLWRFRSSSGLQLPKWEFTWDYGGSFFHILLHSQEHEMWLPSCTFGLHFCKPLPWLWAQG
jgi:hypothetical protein